MTKHGMRIAVDLNDGRKITVDVEEWHPLEPSAYCWDAGWTCYDGDVEYFVSQGGEVYLQPCNEGVGIAPEIRAAADKMEAEISKAMGHDDV